MTTIAEIVVGATVEDQVNKGEAFYAELAFTDQDGAVRSVSGATFSCPESWPASIADDMTFNVISAADGTVAAELSVADAAALTLGRTNWFRVKTVFSNGDIDVSPRIWIQLT